MVENLFKLSTARMVAERLHEILPRRIKDVSEDMLKYLQLPDGEGGTVAHLLVKMGHFFLPEEKCKEVLKLKGKNGWTVAHEQARFFDFVGHGQKGKEVALLEDDNGWTVAHEQVKNGILFPPHAGKELFYAHDKNGWSVAHEYVKRGGYFPTALMYFYGLKDNEGTTVAQVALKRGGRAALEVFKYPYFWEEWGVVDSIEMILDKNPERFKDLAKIIVQVAEPSDIIEEAIDNLSKMFKNVKESRNRRSRWKLK